MVNPFAAALPATINHLLAQETWARARLGKHAGKHARLDAGIVALNLQVTADGLLQAAEDGGSAPDVVISIRLADLPMILQDPKRAASYAKVEGDADFANTISQLSQTLKWEAEEDLSRLVGEVAARRLVSGAKSAVKTAQSTQQAVAENLAEYFLEENPMLVRPAQVTDFGREIVKLRDDLERLEKRIRKFAPGA